MRNANKKSENHKIRKSENQKIRKPENQKNRKSEKQKIGPRLGPRRALARA